MDEKTDKERFSELYQEMYKICNKNNWGDPFSYARGKEIYMANKLGHFISSKFAGADAYEDKEMKVPVEYKSTIQKNISATYNGISLQDTWEEQDKYLKEEKICKYKNHYFARFENGKIIEMYKMTGEKVYEYLMPRLKKLYEKEKKRKDPRLGTNISKKYIVNNSIKLV
tara:strand:- start:296 stop:805 length:510 start_codon:yes stop_codon:yes gene_type:complete